ncbi:MAG TPA: PorP/SprF family type IX secretion system membrane protein, partial [Cytophagaceae bacterium]
MSRIFTILLIVIMSVYKALGQDPQFTQFYAAPLYLNPAFAGATNESRIIFNNRHQWTSLPKAFVTYAASFDHNFVKYNSGVGLIAMVDRAGTGGLTSANIGAIYSYKINLT